MDTLHKGVVIIIKAMKNKGGKILIPERFPNRGEDIRQFFDFIEEGRNRGVKFLEFTKLTANGHGPCHRLRREAGVEGGPGIPGRGGEEHHAGNCWSER